MLTRFSGFGLLVVLASVVPFGCNGLLGMDEGVLAAGGSAGESAGEGAAGMQQGVGGEGGEGGEGGAGVAGGGGETPHNSTSTEGATSNGEPTSTSGCGECEPGYRQPGEQRCGPCGGGIQTRERQCSAACTWQPWSEWSECIGDTSECVPGQKDPQPRACGRCGTGTQYRERICTDSCTWGAWSAWSECSQCDSKNWRCCAAGKWEWCYDSDCSWTGECAACTAPNCDC